MEQLTSGALLDSIRGVRWPARRVVGGSFQGGHRSRRVGSSPEFMQYRAYQQGDDPSKIDWKLYGRNDRVAVRLAHDDSSLHTMILLDASASMAFPTATLAKWELGASVALGLAALAHAGNDPVGLVIAGGIGVTSLPPRTKRGTVANVLRLLLDTAPGGAAPLAPALATIHTSRRVAIVTDFLGDAEQLLEAARELVARGREVYAVHVLAREELEPVAVGDVVTDPERAETMRSMEPGTLAGYQEAFGAWRNSLSARWRAAGVHYSLATTGEHPERVIRRIASPADTAGPRS